MSELSVQQIVVVSLLIAALILLSYGISAGVRAFAARRRATTQARIAGWRRDARAMARAIITRFAAARQTLVAEWQTAVMRRNDAQSELDAYRGTLPDIPAWKQFIYVAITPFAAILIFTQFVADTASFSAQGRPPAVSVVLGLMLAVGLFIIPLVMRLWFDNQRTTHMKVVVVAGTVAITATLVGTAMLISATRGDAQLSGDIAKAQSELAYYQSQGMDGAAQTAQRTVDDLLEKRDRIIEQDIAVAGVLGVGEALLGWQEVTSLAALKLVSLKAKVRRNRFRAERAQNRLLRADAQVRDLILRGATEAGVVDQLQFEEAAPEALPAGDTLEEPEPENVPFEEALPDVPEFSSTIPQDLSQTPVMVPAEAPGEAQIAEPTPTSTTDFDDNI